MSAIRRPQPALPAGPLRYLQPGQLAVSREASTLSTILGSCVAVCLWDTALSLGGMNHYLLPSLPPGASPSTRYGSVAMAALLREIIALGARRERLEAKVFGGAHVLVDRDRLPHLGSRNAEVALQFLESHGIPLVGGDLGGRRGRRLLFETASGEAWVRLL